MQVTIIARDAFTGETIEVKVWDMTSTGPVSAATAARMLESQQARFRTILEYVSHH